MPLLPRPLIALALAVGILGSSWAVQAQDDPIQDVPGCMIRHVRYTARLPETSLTGTPGDPVRITIQLDPETVPTGYFASTNIHVLSAPAPPDILPGFPVSTVVCPEPGEYIIEIVTSLITKSSCGGVSACSLPGRKVTLIIGPSSS